MNILRDHDAVIGAWLDDGPESLPSETRQAITVGIRTVTRRRAGIAWPFAGRGLPTFEPRRLSVALASAAVFVVAAAVALNFYANQQGIGGRSTPSPSATATTSPVVTALLNGFLEARVAGEGAQQYVSVPQEVPLLYATTSGARYERGEFEQVLGIDWPYGLTAFKVRLFAGNTVVAQLFFAGPDGPLLSYERDGFGTDIAPTTENGQPVAVSYGFFVDEVTLRAAHPWIFSAPTTYPNPFCRLIPEGPGVLPTTDGGQRRDGWDRLLLIADPALGGAGCQQGPSSVDAAALAEAIRSDPDLGATAPVAVSVGGAAALMMDVRIAAGTTISVPADDLGNLCRTAILSPVLEQEAVRSSISYANGVATGKATGDWMRLYLIDAPAGSSMRTLAIVIVAPEARFQRAVEAATPVLESLEFHVP